MSVLNFIANVDFGAGLRAAQGFFGKLGRMANDFNEILLAGGTLAQPFLDLGSAIGGGAIQAAAQMEGFEVQLTTLMGSVDAARTRMEALYDFAASTPFSIAQVVQAETTLRGFADTAAEDILPRLMDFSAALNTDVAQSAIDLGKAWSQGATGLESDTGRVLRKQIAQLNGWADDTKIPLAEFREGMLKTLDVNFEGGAARASQTWAGMLSTLEDEWDGFLRQIGEADLFGNAKGALAETLALIQQHRTELGYVAGLVGGALWSGFKGVGYTVAGITDGISALGVGLNKLGAGFLGFTERFAAAEAQILRNLEAAYRFMGLDTAANFMGGLAGHAERASASMGAMSDALSEAAQRTEDAGTATRSFEAFLLSAEQRGREFGAAGEEGGEQAAKGAEAAAEAAKKASKEGERLSATWREAREDLQAMARGAAADHVDATAQIVASLDEQLRRAAGVYEKGQAAQEKARAQGLLGEEAYRERVAELDADYLRAQAEILEASGRALEAHLEQQEEARQAAADRAAGIVAGAVDGELAEVERLQREKVEALRAYLVEAEAAALSEQQIAADRAAILAGYDRQIAQARTQATLAQLGEFQGYISQGLSAMASGLDEGTAAAAARAEALRQQLITGEEFYTAAQREQLDARADAANEAAQRQFELAKLAKIADAEMAGALAFSNALAQNPGPLGLVAAGLAFAAVQGQVASIAAQRLPTAHTGAFVDSLTPDEVVIKATREEAVLSPTARRTLGDQTIARAQAGQSPQAARIIVVDRFRHQIFNRFIKENIRTLSPLSRAISGSSNNIIGVR